MLVSLSTQPLSSPDKNINLMKPTSILSDAGCWLRTSWSLSCLSLLSSFSLTSSWLIRICEWKRSKSFRVSHWQLSIPPTILRGIKYKTASWKWTMPGNCVMCSSRTVAFLRPERMPEIQYVAEARQVTCLIRIHTGSDRVTTHTCRCDSAPRSCPALCDPTD